MLGNIGPLEIGIVPIIALVVFGPKRLPELGKSVGDGMREFKGSISGDADGERPSPPRTIEHESESEPAQETGAHRGDV